MNLLRTASVLIGLTISFSVHASPTVVRDIVRLSRAIENAAPVSGIPEENLLEVREKLSEALDLLQAGDGEPNEPTLPLPGCVDFAYEKYSMNLSSPVATDKAIAACKKIVDLNVAKYVFEKHNINLNATVSMDKAAEQSNQTVRGKFQVISIAYDAYVLNLSSTVAISRSLTNAATVSKQSAACLKSLYDKYAVNLSPTVAMDKAFEGCK